MRRPGGATALVVVFGAVMFGTTLPTPLYPLYEHQLGFGEQTTTVVFATYAAGQVIATLGFGSWSDQLGRKPLLAAAIALSAASALVYLLPRGLGWLYAGRLLSGLSAGAVTAAATPMLVELLPRRRTTATVLGAAVNMGGLGVGVLSSGLLAQWSPHPLVVPFLVDLALLVLATAALATLPETVGRSRPLRLRLHAARVPRRARGAFTRASMSAFAGFAVLALFTAVSPAFVSQVLHISSHAIAGLVACTAFAGSLAGQLLSIVLANRRSETLGCAALVLGMAGVGTGLAASALLPLVAGSLVAGAGQGLVLRSGLVTIAAASPPDRRAELTACYFVIAYVGSALPVIGLGIASTHVGLVDAGVAFAAGVAGLAGVVIALLRRAAPVG